MYLNAECEDGDDNFEDESERQLPHGRHDARADRHTRCVQRTHCQVTLVVTGTVKHSH